MPWKQRNQTKPNDNLGLIEFHKKVPLNKVFLRIKPTLREIKVISPE